MLSETNGTGTLMRITQQGCPSSASQLLWDGSAGAWAMAVAETNTTVAAATPTTYAWQIGNPFFDAQGVNRKEIAFRG